MAQLLYLTKFTQAHISLNGHPIIANIDWSIGSSEIWWITGPSGCGKTLLLETLAKKRFMPSDQLTYQDGIDIGYMPQDLSSVKEFRKTATFYQQRYFSQGADDTPLTCRFVAQNAKCSIDTVTLKAKEWGLDALMGKHVISLSTGEGKRVLLLIFALQHRRLVCIDNPFAGIDAQGKNLICEMVSRLKQEGCTVVMTGMPEDLPPETSHVLEIANGTLAYTGIKARWPMPGQLLHTDAKKMATLQLSSFLYHQADYDFDVAIKMRNISIKLNQQVLFDGMDWTVAKGEKWLVTGPNGSGKSTLMSLIYADNPKAYAQHIEVFGRRRGTGESIWDVKRKIGFFSSELQQFFPKGLTVKQAIQTGFSDHFTPKRTMEQWQTDQIESLLDHVGMRSLGHEYLSRLSFAQVRLALIMRAIVKNAPLLILDEPTQAMDDHHTHLINNLVDAVCCSNRSTLVYITHRTDVLPRCIGQRLELGR
ncbi:MAG: ATP-binding cassette domain-containing protein [Breznakibacter sp.]